jgi:hypothetical protein
MATSTFNKQISNRNFLSAVGFQFMLTRDPKISFFSNAAGIPEINLGLAVQPSYLKDIDVPGEKLTYGDFNLKFLVDEDMQNYMSIHNWLTGLGFPESTSQYGKVITSEDNGLKETKNAFSDGSLRILNSNYNTVAQVRFKDLFPISLSALEFSTEGSDIVYLTANAVFKYTVYNILDVNGKPL